METYEIKAAIIGKGKQIKDLANTEGVTSSAVSQVIKGKTRSKKLRRAIAAVIGKPVSEIWPENTTEGEKAA